MAIKFKYDLATVAPPSNDLTRKFGQSLVLQQQQQKYSGQQAGYDRLFRAGSQLQQQNWQGTRDKQINDFQAARDKQQFDWKQQEAETARQAGFLDDARKMSTGIIMDDIKNGAYDTATASQLRQNLIDEAEALGNPNLDATQRAEILAKIRAKRATLTANRIEAPPKPTPDEELRGSIRTLNGIDFKKDKDGIWQPVDYGKGQQGQQQPPQPQRPTSVDDAIRADSKRYDAILDYEITALTGEDKPLTPELLDQARERARKQYEKELGLGTPTLAPELPDSGSKPTGFGTSSAAYYNAPDSKSDSQSAADRTVQPPDPGRPPSPVQQREPMPPVSNDGSQNPAYQTAGGQQTQPQQVTVGGKPLAVTPGTLTPQETAARGQIMELPREQRIAALMPYDQELKGRTLEQLLEDPETKAGYAEMTKQGLTTGNYREDMLGHIDEMLQHNVLNAAGQSPPSAYVGMRADEVTDPKAKAEVDKMPRPKTADEMKAVRGKYFIDPNGIIRGTQKQA